MLSFCNLPGIVIHENKQEETVSEIMPCAQQPHNNEDKNALVDDVQITEPWVAEVFFSHEETP